MKCTDTAVRCAEGWDNQDRPTNALTRRSFPTPNSTTAALVTHTLNEAAPRQLLR
jgi:hypothetical protein